MCMRIWCFPFLCFGEKEEDSVTATSFSLYSLCCRNKEEKHMREGVLGNEINEMDGDDSDLGFWANFENGGGREGLGVQATDERVHENEANERLDFDGEFREKGEDFLLWSNDNRARSADGASGSQGLKVDVNLKLGLGGEPSSSTSTMMATGRETADRDSQNKRPKVHSFSL